MAARRLAAAAVISRGSALAHGFDCHMGVSDNFMNEFPNSLCSLLPYLST